MAKRDAAQPTDPISDEQAHAVAKAAAVIRRGGLVAMPTETVYGLAANALDARAVGRIFEAKGRPRFDPLIVHIAETPQVPLVVRRWPEAAWKLARAFWPGPLTLVVPKAVTVPDIVTAGLSGVAVRMPDHPLALRLIRGAGLPLAAPSANRFGRVSPTTAEHVRTELGDVIDCLLDGGPCATGVESTVVSLMDEQRAQLLRPGGLPREEIEALVGPLHPPDAQQQPAGPGMTPRHYAPGTLLRCVDEGEYPPTDRRVGLLSLRPAAADLSGRFDHVEALSPDGDLRTAAARLFAALRRLDEAPLDEIWAYPVPDHGLGLAINDRLRRASHRDASDEA